MIGDSQKQEVGENEAPCCHSGSQFGLQEGVLKSLLGTLGVCRAERALPIGQRRVIEVEVERFSGQCVVSDDGEKHSGASQQEHHPPDAALPQRGARESCRGVPSGEYCQHTGEVQCPQSDLGWLAAVSAGRHLHGCPLRSNKVHDAGTEQPHACHPVHHHTPPQRRARFDGRSGLR